ncbi:MAG: SpoIID/LytB domain-containing protein, partial [Ignavibacteriaceae bacterium]
EKILVLKGNEIRSILRTSDNKGILWSTMFDVSMNSNSITLTGNGFGHGVGLCQWGAIAMSRNGKNFDEILQHYYPGTQLKKLND